MAHVMCHAHTVFLFFLNTHKIFIFFYVDDSRIKCAGKMIEMKGSGTGESHTQ